MDLTHLDEKGRARMVDVGDKAVTRRAAAAGAVLRMKPETLRALLEGTLKKGDALAAARIAGIMAAKRTWELIPLCHSIPIEHAAVEFEPLGDDRLSIRAELRTEYRTGIEMEALTAVSVAALTVYDMCKAIDRGMVIEEIKLLEKTGGKSDYHDEG